VTKEWSAELEYLAKKKGVLAAEDATDKTGQDLEIALLKQAIRELVQECNVLRRRLGILDARLVRKDIDKSSEKQTERSHCKKCGQYIGYHRQICPVCSTSRYDLGSRSAEAVD
jgi:hypothetical protein